MANTDYIPKDQDDRYLWYDNIEKKIDLYGPGTEVNLAAGKVAKIKTDCQQGKASTSAKKQEEETYHKEVAKDKAVQKTSTGSLRKIFGDMKRMDKVTDAVEKDLGIKSTVIERDTDADSPLVVVERLGNNWKFNFNLLNFYTGVIIYRKKPGEADFSKRDIDLSTPWIETEDIPAGTQYKFRYFLHDSDNETGKFSDIITIDV